MTADVVHTLFALGLKEPATPGATLEGKLSYEPPAGYATVPAKVVIECTDFSTTTDADGRYRFRNVPPGRYSVWVLATGYEAERVKDVVLEAGKATTVEPKLKPDAVPGNLVRNPRFALKWILPDQPDGWTRDTAKTGPWASAPIRVPVNHPCTVGVEWTGDARVPVSLRWRRNPSSTADSREVALDVAKLPTVIATYPLLKPFEKGYLFLEVLLHTDKPPEEVFRHVAVTFAKK